MTWTADEADRAAQAGAAAAGAMTTRRRLLCLSGLSAAALTAPELLGRLMAGAPAHAGPGRTVAGESPGESPGATDLGWNQFLEQSVPVARALHRDSSAGGQDAYLFWLASMIVRLRTGELPRAKLGRFGGLEPPVNIGVSFRGQPFFIVEWWLEPGAFLPPHCHPNASVCTLGIAGEARVRNFEVDGDAPDFSSRRTFLVRETHDQVIAPGRVCTLSALRDNIHTFRAGPRGARGIDISTYHGPATDFSFLDIADKTRDASRRVYEAAWKKL